MTLSPPDTPLMRQYREIKSQHEDAILLFRLGDFYEMFFEDAEVASKILDIALTSRDKNSKNPVPLCGVPFHSISGYISQLLEKGHKVAICDQVEEAKPGKGLVRREVVRVVSPGARTDLEGLEAEEHNYLVSVFPKGSGFGLSWLEVASGRFFTHWVEDLLSLEDEVWKLDPLEILIPESSQDSAISNWGEAISSTKRDLRIEKIPSWVYDEALSRLRDRFSVGSLDGLGLDEESPYIGAAAALLFYVEEQNRSHLAHLQIPRRRTSEEVLLMDRATQENLELVKRRGSPGYEHSLFCVLNETESAKGARLLQSWILQPLREIPQIEERLEAVEDLQDRDDLREGLRRSLREVYDLERLIGRVACKRATPRDLLALRQTLRTVPEMSGELKSSSAKLIERLRKSLNPHQDLSDRLSSIVSDPPLSAKSGGCFEDGFHSELDELRVIQREGKSWIASLEREERVRTGIPSLKVGYNRVFGYYLEVTKTHLSKVPLEYIRKQTLASAERYITPDLKEKEDQILKVDEKISRLEEELFEEIQKEVIHSTNSLQKLADNLAEIDVLCSLARVAGSFNYVRPSFIEGCETKIRDGRHPVVERFMLKEPFVPNDIELNTENQQLMILTGPNMAGKSTIMRQVGLITIMAQMGSFVPASEAKLGVSDQLFTRVGASDDLARGRSTFMVEMSETSNILRNATRESLILLDEIGRGTSTYDGVAIAWSVAEDLHDRIGARAIFATHYHELTDLERTKARVVNYNVAVREYGGKVIFLRMLKQGAVNRSYGIEVARLAGVPETVITRAKEILANLEKNELNSKGQPSWVGQASEDSQDQLQLFRAQGEEVLEELRKVDPEELTPKEALELLFALQQRLR